MGGFLSLLPFILGGLQVGAAATGGRNKRSETGSFQDTQSQSGTTSQVATTELPREAQPLQNALLTQLQQLIQSPVPVSSGALDQLELAERLRLNQQNRIFQQQLENNLALKGLSSSPGPSALAQGIAQQSLSGGVNALNRDLAFRRLDLPILQEELRNRRFGLAEQLLRGLPTSTTITGSTQSDVTRSGTSQGTFTGPGSTLSNVFSAGAEGLSGGFLLQKVLQDMAKRNSAGIQTNAFSNPNAFNTPAVQQRDPALDALRRGNVFIT